MAPILSVTNLTKYYGQFKAVDDISFSINEGEILGLLGPNGAGKTTTMQMLLGLTSATAGSIRYFNKEFSNNRSESLTRINFVSAYNQMQGRATVRQNLHVFSRIYDVKNWENKAKELVTLLGVEDKLDTLCWHLSSGERTRVNMVKALINSPELILMDEPTASLDPEIVNIVLDLIADMRKRNKVAILYTSHNMVEVSRICDRVSFLDHGKIVITDTPLGLSKRVGLATLEIIFDGEEKPVVSYLAQEHLSYAMIRPHLISIQINESLIPKILFGLGKKNVWITDIEIKKPDLEDVFMAIAKGGIDALETN